MLIYFNEPTKEFYVIPAKARHCCTKSSLRATKGSVAIQKNNKNVKN